MLIEQYCVITSFLFLYPCYEFEQVKSGWLILYVFSCKGESIWNERCWTPLVAAFSDLHHEEQKSFYEVALASL